MNIKNNKVNKIIMILLFMALLIIVIGNNNTFAVENVKITSIKGNNWTIYEYDTDYNLAKLYKEVEGLSTADIKAQTLPTGLHYLKAGNELGATSTSETSFNRKGCIGDCSHYWAQDYRMSNDMFSTPKKYWRSN